MARGGLPLRVQQTLEAGELPRADLFSPTSRLRMLTLLGPAIAMAAPLPEPGPNLTTVLVTLFTTLATILTAYFGVRQYQHVKAKRESERSGPPSDPQELDTTEDDRPSRHRHPPSDLFEEDYFDPPTSPERPSRLNRESDGRYDSDPKAARKPPKPPSHRKSRPQ